MSEHEYYVDADKINVMRTKKGSRYIGDQEIVALCATGDAGGMKVALRIAKMLNGSSASAPSSRPVPMAVLEGQIERLRKNDFAGMETMRTFALGISDDLLTPSTATADEADAGQRIRDLAVRLTVAGWMAGEHGLDAATKNAERELLDFACDEIKRHMARATPTPSAARTDWQDISTAPKDGTWVLIWEDYGTNNRFSPADVARYYLDYWQNGEKARVHNATHWMPLPGRPIPRNDRGNEAQ